MRHWLGYITFNHILLHLRCHLVENTALLLVLNASYYQTSFEAELIRIGHLRISACIGTRLESVWFSLTTVLSHGCQSRQGYNVASPLAWQFAVYISEKRRVGIASRHIRFVCMRYCQFAVRGRIWRHFLGESAM